MQVAVAHGWGVRVTQVYVYDVGPRAANAAGTLDRADNRVSKSPRSQRADGCPAALLSPLALRLGVARLHLCCFGPVC
jgi:hypothetical protein